MAFLYTLRRWERLCVAARYEKMDNYIKEVKYSYSNSKRVASIKVDNIDKSKVYDETNYVFIGNSIMVIKGNEIQYV